jgi:hypothetical protein
MSMADVPSDEAGLASAITNVSQQVGGAFGIAVLSTLATTHSRTLAAQHVGLANALVGGYHLAFTVGAGSVLTAIVVAGLLLRSPRTQPEPVAEPTPIIPLRRATATAEIAAEHEHAA